MSVKIDFSIEGRASVVAISGKLTCENSDGLTTRFSMWLEKKHPVQCVFDLSKLDFMDSSGIGGIMSCLHKVRKLNGDIALAGAQGTVLLALKISRIHEILRLFDSVAAASETIK